MGVSRGLDALLLKPDRYRPFRESVQRGGAAAGCKGGLEAVTRSPLSLPPHAHDHGHHDLRGEIRAVVHSRRGR